MIKWNYLTLIDYCRIIKNTIWVYYLYFCTNSMRWKWNMTLYERIDTKTWMKYIPLKNLLIKLPIFFTGNRFFLRVNYKFSTTYVILINLITFTRVLWPFPYIYSTVLCATLFLVVIVYLRCESDIGNHLW